MHFQDVWSKKTWKKSDSSTPKKAYEPKTFDKDTSQRIESQNLRFKGLTSNAESDKIISDKCIISKDKISKYFLKSGAKHSQEFFDVGYTKDDFERLSKDLLECFDYEKAVDVMIDEKGIEKFSIFTELGINKKKRFRTVWQKDTPDSLPRIITAHREDK